MINALFVSFQLPVIFLIGFSMLIISLLIPSSMYPLLCMVSFVEDQRHCFVTYRLYYTYPIRNALFESSHLSHLSAVKFFFELFGNPESRTSASLKGLLSKSAFERIIFPQFHPFLGRAILLCFDESDIFTSLLQKEFGPRVCSKGFES